ncbi:hypothetical protein TYRP_021481, partial [Tyrophagus putrescentiae]
MAAHSSEGQAINTKLFYMIFLAIRIKYMFHEHHSHPKIKVLKSTMPPSYDTDVVTVVFRKLRSLPMAAQSSEDHSINAKLFYMKFLTILIKYIFHEHHSHPKIKIRKSSQKVRGVPP